MSTVTSANKKNTILTFQQKKIHHTPISMLTAYDYPTAVLVDNAGVDAILVGDSLGMVVLGYENTLPVTMEDMLHHCKAVARGAHRALLVGDMPFMSYQVSVSEAVRNAGRFLQEASMDAIKLEGGRERLDAIKAILQAGIPVMGHLGLTPQSVHQFGGFRLQGNTAEAAKLIIEDARMLQETGCFSLVLESVPAQVAEIITHELTIPTIGIGAGKSTDGQVLVLHDLLGVFDRFKPKFVKQYANLFTQAENAILAYKTEVEGRQFPGDEQTSSLTVEELEKLHRLLRTGSDDD
jgi:3-methyl-2-oxobutanoate hydroxymethyltransferase